MPDTVLHMRGTGSGGTENAIVTIDIPADGVITGVQVAHHAVVNADTEVSTAELSFIATNQVDTNDSRGGLVISRVSMGLLTSGGGNMSNNFFVPMDVRVAGGERLHMNLVASTGVVAVVSFMVHLRAGVTRRSGRRT